MWLFWTGHGHCTDRVSCTSLSRAPHYRLYTVWFECAFDVCVICICLGASLAPRYFIHVQGARGRGWGTKRGSYYLPLLDSEAEARRLPSVPERRAARTSSRRESVLKPYVPRRIHKHARVARATPTGEIKSSNARSKRRPAVDTLSGAKRPNAVQNGMPTLIVWLCRACKNQFISAASMFRP